MKWWMQTQNNFEYFKEEEAVKSWGQKLRGVDFSVNSQFLKEILEQPRSCSQSKRSSPLPATFRCF